MYPTDTPDSRNERISNDGVDRTRPGTAKTHTTALPSHLIYRINFKSGFCKENYKIGFTNDGRVLVGIEDLIPIPQKDSIVAYWQMDNPLEQIPISQKASLVAYWKMEDATP